MITFNPFAMNPVALLLAIAAHMAIGFLWYSPILFGNIWLRGMKLDPNNITMHAGHLIGGALIGLCLALAFGHLNSMAGIRTCQSSIEYALTYWLGFVATTQFSLVIWAGKAPALWLVDIGCWAVDFVVISCIMTKFA